MVRAYYVFNAAQVDGYEFPEIPTIPETERIALAEAFFSATGAVIKEQGNRAFYRPSTDEITMPPFAHFKMVEYFYSTLAHELTHWTALPERCNRVEALSGRFGSQAYAMEELVAELGSAFLSADLGLALEPRIDHAGYIESWLNALRKDRRAIFAAAAKAQIAVDWLRSPLVCPSLVRQKKSMADQISSRQGYQALLQALKEQISKAQVRAAVAVNRELIVLYWNIGREILTRQQKDGWGTKVIERLAKDLRTAFPEMQGLSARNLGYTKAFAEAWSEESIFATSCCKITVGS